MNIPISKIISVREKRKTKERRFPPLFYLTEAMDDGETKTFNRRIKPSCKMRRTHFTVMKRVEPQIGGIRGLTFFNFYAKYDFQREVVEDFIEVPGGSDTRKYDHQIAIMRCGPGWIHQLTVFEKSVETTPQINPYENARLCGIGVLLTELCMLDLGISRVNNDNKARRELSTFSFPLFGSCQRLVGLTLANPQAAHVWFHAARRAGYNKLIVRKSCNEGRGTECEDTNSHSIWDLETARGLFDENSGRIEPLCGHNRCEVRSCAWYFCSDT